VFSKFGVNYLNLMTSEQIYQRKFLKENEEKIEKGLADFESHFSS
jgi:hypothetical protein